MIFFKKKKSTEQKSSKAQPLTKDAPLRILTARGWIKKRALAKEQKASTTKYHR